MLNRGIIPSLGLRDALLLQPRIPLVFFAVGVHCWLTFSLLPTGTSRIFSVELLLGLFWVCSKTFVLPSQRNLPLSSNLSEYIWMTALPLSTSTGVLIWCQQQTWQAFALTSSRTLMERLSGHILGQIPAVLYLLISTEVEYNPLATNLWAWSPKLIFFQFIELYIHIDCNILTWMQEYGGRWYQKHC